MKLISKTLTIAAGLALAATSAFADDSNKICPIMIEDEIDEEEFSEFEGKKVYFCCTSCKKQFDASPKYIIKVAGMDALPQFKGMEETLKLDEVELLEQKFCPIYTDSLINPESPTIEYKGKKIYFFKKRAIDKWEKDPEGKFKEATEAGLLPQFEENKKSAEEEETEEEEGTGEKKGE